VDRDGGGCTVEKLDKDTQVIVCLLALRDISDNAPRTFYFPFFHDGRGFELHEEPAVITPDRFDLDRDIRKEASLNALEKDWQYTVMLPWCDKPGEMLSAHLQW